MVKSAGRRSALLVAAVVLAGAVLWFGQDGMLIGVSRSGGFAGRTDSVMIWESGTVLVLGARSSARTRLTPGQYRRLRDALDAADFAHLPPQRRRGADMYQFQIVHGRWSVTVDGPFVVPWLSAVLRVPEEVMHQHGAR